MLSYSPAEIPQEYENRVKEFYSRVGQTQLSRAKIEAGSHTIRRLVEEEEFTLSDVDYAMEWIIKSVDTRFDGSVKSLGLLSYVMGEALQEKVRKDRKKQQLHAKQAEKEQEERNIASRKRVEHELNGLDTDDHIL